MRADANVALGGVVLGLGLVMSTFCSHNKNGSPGKGAGGISATSGGAMTTGEMSSAGATTTTGSPRASIPSSAGGSTTIAETFTAADKPSLQKDAVEDFLLQLPWNYDKPQNATRAYPLVVGLHPSGGSYYQNFYAGNESLMKTTPAFYMAPHSSAGSWTESASWVVAQIEALKKKYRIDANRLYVVGFSMGGSGSYAVANAYCDLNGQLFAGILRMAGQSQTTLCTAAAKKTSVWYHIGLDDDAARVQVARDAYAFIKSFADNASAKETIVSDTILAFPRSTATLTKNGVEIMKKSDYTGMGHEDGGPLADPTLSTWLFSQSLANR